MNSADEILKAYFNKNEPNYRPSGFPRRELPAASFKPLQTTNKIIQKKMKIRPVRISDPFSRYSDFQKMTKREEPDSQDKKDNLVLNEDLLKSIISEQLKFLHEQEEEDKMTSKANSFKGDFEDIFGSPKKNLNVKQIRRFGGFSRKLKKVKKTTVLETIPEEEASVLSGDVPKLEIPKPVRVNKIPAPSFQTSFQHTKSIHFGTQAGFQSLPSQQYHFQFQNINIYNIYNSASSNLGKRPDSGFNQECNQSIQIAHETNAGLEKESSASPEPSQKFAWENITKMSNFSRNIFSEPRSKHETRRRNRIHLNGIDFKIGEVFKKKGKKAKAKTCNLEEAKVENPFCQDVFWNSFLKEKGLNTNYATQIESFVKKKLGGFEPQNLEKVDYTEKTVYMLMQLQVPMDNVRFQAMDRRAKMRILGVIFSKFFDRHLISTRFENFWLDVDFRKPKKASDGIYGWGFILSMWNFLISFTADFIF